MASADAADAADAADTVGAESGDGEEEEWPSPLGEMHITGTQVNYYFVCTTKLWLFSHHIQLEHGSGLVQLGSLLHQTSYRDDARKNTIIDDTIGIDFIRRGNMVELHEVKRSRAIEAAHRWQLLYYCYYLEQKGVRDVVGVLDYPRLRQRERVELTDAARARLESILDAIETIVNGPPVKPKKKKICRKCAYFEFCFGA